MSNSGTNTGTDGGAGNQRLKELQQRHLLHSEHDWTLAADRGPVIMARAEGCRVWDIDGREYLDAQGGLCLVNIGYGRPEPAAAARRQMLELPYYHTYWRFGNVPAVELAARVAALAPPGLEHVYFTPGGAEAVEVAIKLARLYQRSRGAVDRVQVLSFQNAYHGSTFGALAATGLAAHREPFQPLPAGFVHLPPPDLFRGPWRRNDPAAGRRYAELVEAAIRQAGADTVAAFIAEPIPAVGGVTVPPADYWQHVRRICDRYGVLLIADEVLTGFGRTGTLWCLDGYGVAPDLLVMAKGLTSGYLPLGAVAAHRRIGESLAAARLPFLHGHTYSGHPVACAVALETVRILLDEDLPARAAAQGVYLQDCLRAAGNPHFGDVRGRGLLVGVELVDAGGAPATPGVQFAVEAACMERGVIVGVCPYRPVVLLTPPLTISQDEIDQLVTVLDAAVRQALG